MSSLGKNLGHVVRAMRCHVRSDDGLIPADGIEDGLDETIDILTLKIRFIP